MPHGIEIELIDRIKPMVRDLVTERAATLADLRYAGVRLEVSEGRYATAENGAPKASGDDCALAFGIRVLAGNRMIAPGYFGRGLGVADLAHLEQILRDGLLAAYRRAMANAEQKALVRAKYPAWGRRSRTRGSLPCPCGTRSCPPSTTSIPAGSRSTTWSASRRTSRRGSARSTRRSATTLRRPRRALPRAIRLFGGSADRSVLRLDPGPVLCRGGGPRQ